MNCPISLKSLKYYISPHPEKKLQLLSKMYIKDQEKQEISLIFSNIYFPDIYLKITKYETLYHQPVINLKPENKNHYNTYLCAYICSLIESGIYNFI